MLNILLLWSFISANHQAKSKSQPDNKEQLFNPEGNDFNFDL